METCDDVFDEPVEYVDAVCLDKNIILPDGCTTTTLTTADGESMPVTFIVSQDFKENVDENSKVEETITSDDCELPQSSESENISDVDLKNEMLDKSPVYGVHFPNKQSHNFLTMSNNEVLNVEKNMVPSDNSVDSEFLDQQTEMESLTPVTRLEDFMDVVTTYKCKFCRFSCPWKSGLMSHIRCCHINEKKSIVMLKPEKDNKTVVPNKNVKKGSANISHVKAAKEQPAEPKQSAISEKPPVFSEKPPVVDQSADSEIGDENFCSKDAPIERHIFLCGQCSEGFVTLDDCKQHMINDHNLKLGQKPAKKRGRPKTRPCIELVIGSSTESESKCTKTSDASTPENKRQIRPPKNLEDDYDFGVKKKGRRESLSEKNFRCSRSGCGHRFSSESNLHYHYSSHCDVGKTFMCPECREEFEHWRGLVMHLWKEHGVDIDLHVCTDCDYKTYSFFKLDNHRKIHSEERGFVCEQCGKGFKQISQLRNHLVIHLDRKNLPQKRWYSEQECDTCGRKFSDTKCLRKHQQAVHSKLKPYVCSYCGHLSARKAMLELHMRQHTGEKPFLCEHCDYRTGDHNSLRRHRMRHTGAKPYKCPHCPYACIQAISYKTHLRNKHPGMDGLFSCTLCTFKSVSKENYINHMSDHKRESEISADNSAKVSENDSETKLDGESSDQAAVQMQLTDNALQQLEGILPSNITAAQLIYSCLNALSQDGGTVSLPPGVTVNIPSSSTTSSDGTQTITIQLPSSQDMENEPYYFTIQQQDGATALLVPSEDDNKDCNASSNSDLESVQFAQDISNSGSLDCVVLPEEDSSGQLQPCNSDLVIAQIECFEGSDEFNSEVITDNDNQNDS